MKKFLFLIFNLFLLQYAFSQWNSDPSVNNLIANPVNDNSLRLSVSDGANGSISLFEGDNGNIYVQKITATGSIAWGTTASPVIVCNAAADQYAESIISDGSGGAYISWSDYRNDPDFGEIYMQHISTSGVNLWAANGIRVTNINTRDDFGSQLCGDGAGGVIVTWVWDNYLSNIQQNAQRYNSAGVAQWAANGVQLCTAPGFRAGNCIAPDGAGGAIVFFTDTRNDPNGTNYNYLDSGVLVNADIYAQRISSNGALLWTANGAAVCTAPLNQDAFGEANTAVIDGSGGAILSFLDVRNNVPDPNGNYSNYDIYAQRLNSGGAAQWVTNGIAITTAVDNQFIASVTGDGTGSIVVAYQDGSNDRIFGQRLTASGTAAWGANGVAISPATIISYDAVVTADGTGNYIFCYNNSSVFALQAQKLNAAGIPQWNANGVVVNSGSASNYGFYIVASDNGSAIISWTDQRAINGQDIYASKVLSTGILAGTSSSGYISIANGNWNNPAIWSGGAVPPATAAVTVRHQVTVTASAICRSLRVEQPAGNVIVKTGTNLTITN